MRRGSPVSRISALGLLALLVGILAFGVVKPLVDERTRLTIQLEKERRNLVLLTSRITALQTELATPVPVHEQIAWAGQRAGEISAELQVGISTIASQSGFSLRSLRTDQGEELLGAQTLLLEVEFETVLDQAMTFLELVEAHKPTFLLQDLSLRRVATPPGDALQPSVYAIVRLVAPVDLETTL